MTRYTILADALRLQQAIQQSSSKREAIRSLGINYNTRAIHAFDNACKQLNIVVEFADRYASKNKIDLEQILVDNSTYMNNRSSLGARLIRAGKLKGECYICGLGPEWNDLPLVLQLDHINGKNSDHRLENLRMLCPNCHTQTPTYAGRRIAEYERRTCARTGCEAEFIVTRPSSRKSYCSVVCSNRRHLPPVG